MVTELPELISRVPELLEPIVKFPELMVPKLPEPTVKPPEPMTSVGSRYKWRVTNLMTG